MYAVATPSRTSNTTVRTRIRRTVGRKVNRFAARSPRATSRDLLDDMRNSVGVFMDRVRPIYDCVRRMSYVKSRTEGRLLQPVVSLNHLESEKSRKLQVD